MDKFFSALQMIKTESSENTLQHKLRFLDTFIVKPRITDVLSAIKLYPFPRHGVNLFS